MSNYGTPQAGSPEQAPGLRLTSLMPGDTFKLWDAETVTPAQASVAVSIANAADQGSAPPIVFTVAYASAPTAVIQIQGSNTDIDGDYQTLFTSTSLQHDFYADQGGFKYYRANLVSQSAGGTVTVVVKR